MAYTISNTDGTTLLVLADGTIDQATTSLTLIGKNYSGFGAAINNNFVKLLANSASSSGNPPRSPLTGQLWYDTTNRRVMVYDGVFKTISGATVSTDKPTLGIGDFWFDSSKGQLNMRTGVSTATTVIGPLFPKAVGENGWVLPSPTVKDLSDNVQDITLLKNYGTTLGVISRTAFTTTYATFTSTTVTPTVDIVNGLTILGNIKSNTGTFAHSNIGSQVVGYSLVSSNTGTVNNDTTIVGVNLFSPSTVTISIPRTIPGRLIIIKDEKGTASAYPITISPSVPGGTIDGNSTFVINTNYGVCRIYSPNGASWFTV
jgi:hypothetical protein